MKKLNPIPSLDDVWVPEDGVDRRTAASLEPAFQAILNRSEYAFLVLRRLRIRGLPQPPGLSPQLTGLSFADDDGERLFLVTKQLSGGDWRILSLDLADFTRFELVDPPLTPPSSSSTLVLTLVGGALYLAGENFSSGLWRSTDQGATWSQVAAEEIFPLAQHGDTALGITGNGTLYRSGDAGASWSEVAGAPLVQRGRWSVEWAFDRWWLAANDGGLYASNDDGLTWTQIPGEVAAFARFDIEGRLWVRPDRYTSDGATFSPHVTYIPRSGYEGRLPFALLQGAPVWGVYDENGYQLASPAMPNNYGYKLVPSKTVLLFGAVYSGSLIDLAGVIG